MVIRPQKKALVLLGIVLTLPGLLLALVVGVFSLWVGLALGLCWAAAVALGVRFRLASLCAAVEGDRLTVGWGTAFPQTVILPLNGQTCLHSTVTPMLGLLGCCLVQVITPCGRVVLWAVKQQDRDALAALLAEV